MLLNKVLERLSRCADGKSREPSVELKREDVLTRTMLFNYENSPLRWSFDALLAEYAALRNEIDQVAQKMERTYGYLLALIGAIFASQLLSSATVSKINERPTLYLVAALLSLWFPANNLCMAVDMTSLGSYLREVLLPKLNAIATTAAESAAGHTISAASLQGWTDSVAQILPVEMRRGLEAPMTWEQFLPRVRLGPRRQQIALAPIYSMRTALLYAPTALLVGLSVMKVQHIDVAQIVLLILIGSFLIAALVANITVAGLVTFAMRKGPFSVASETARGGADMGS